MLDCVAHYSHVLLGNLVHEHSSNPSLCEGAVISLQACLEQRFESENLKIEIENLMMAAGLLLLAISLGILYRLIGILLLVCIPMVPYIAAGLLRLSLGGQVPQQARFCTHVLHTQSNMVCTHKATAVICTDNMPVRTTLN